ncbi:transglycosylase family protein [Streptacidiphilus jiangxiensis]|uniref:Transglycosylase-like domain-containing protein n=1 Tax=Streptacidiphilus jiangxiensis TaxID=235985 RepID=A0A1H8AB44_STRJI|nr:transglycosylase family protein [Streptacidiphilus jiangxiensis]SEM67028.1 Transglycosylase-like domain-containing protein [Streptacidiphilus jiangxiensis]
MGTALMGAASKGTARRRLLVGGTATAAAALLCALPMVSDTASAQVPTSVWDQLAMCESSGRWHIDTGNGFYGGLQISLETWREAGGTRYAPRPDLAAKAEQIAVAEVILAWQGWDAWPGCSRDLGLHGRPPVGVTHSPSPAPTPRPTHKPTPTPTPTPKPTPTPPVTVPATYVVRHGDHLAAIARRFHLPGGWQALYARNRALIGPNPDNLLAGTVLRLR